MSKTTGFVPRGKVAAGAAELMEGGVADLIVADIDKKVRFFLYFLFFSLLFLLSFFHFILFLCPLFKNIIFQAW